MRGLSIGVLAVASPSFAQISVDPDGIGAVDVATRALGSADPFAPLPLDATGLFSPGAAVDLRVGFDGNGSILFHNAGSVSFDASVGRDGPGAGRLTLSGNTFVSVGPGDRGFLFVGDQASGELIISDGASLIMAGAGFIFGGFEPATVRIERGGVLEVDRGGVSAGSPSALGSRRDATSPADGRVSTILVDGAGSELRTDSLIAGANMNSTITVSNGGRWSILPQESVLLGSFIEAAPSVGPTPFETTLRVDGGVVDSQARFRIGQFHDTTLVIENGGVFENRTEDFLLGTSLASSGVDISVTIRGTGSALRVDSMNVSTSASVELRVLDGAELVADNFRRSISSPFRPMSITVEGEGSRLSGAGGQSSGVLNFADLIVGRGAEVAISNADFGRSFTGDPARLVVKLGAEDIGAAARFVTDRFEADGILEFTVADGVAVDAGDTFDLYDFQDFGLFGWFDVVTPPLPQGLAWDLSRLEIDGTVSIAEMCSPADLVPPFGVADLDDLDAFIVAFLNDESQADLAAPIGILDLADVDAFTAAFVAGCS